MKEKIKEFVLKNKVALIYYSVLFVVFTILSSLFPYSGDDWAWGSSDGLGRLENFFEGYNGRYAGNLLVIVLTRLETLKTLVVAVAMLLCCIVPVIYSRTKKVTAVLTSTLLFLVIPIDIFKQGVVWTSGFANYVPPILIALFYSSAISNVFSDKSPRYTVKKEALLSGVFLILSFIGSLFMENVTLFNIAISICIIVYVLVRWRRVYPIHLSYFFGSVIGAVTMFSNSVYHSISEGEDGYREMAQGEEFWEMLAENASAICKGIFVNALPLFIFLSVLCVVSALRFARGERNPLMKNLALACIGINLVSLFVFIAHDQFANWQMVWGDEKKSALALGAFVIAYCLSVLFTVLITVDGIGEKARLILPLVSVVLLVVPLLVVTPIGPRCFFPPYLALSVFCVCFLNYLTKNTASEHPDSVKLAAVALLAACIGSLFFLGNTYKTLNQYVEKRDYYIQRQIELGYETVTVAYMPYTVNAHALNISKGYWETCYKRFYHIDEDIKFTYLATEKFDEWAEKFDEKHSK